MKLAEDFVTQNCQAVSRRDLRKFFDLIFGGHMTGGVVRRKQDYSARLGGDAGFQILQVYSPRPGFPQEVLDHPYPAQRRDVIE